MQERLGERADDGRYAHGRGPVFAMALHRDHAGLRVGQAPFGIGPVLEQQVHSFERAAPVREHSGPIIQCRYTSV